MNPAFALSLVATVVGVIVALLGWGCGSAPGWARYRAFSLVATTAALYCAAEALSATQIDDGALAVVMRLQGAATALNVAGWIVYTRRFLGLPQRRSERVLVGLLVVVAVISQVPGLALDSQIEVVSLPSLHVTYRLPVSTVFGGLLFVLDIGLLCIPAAQYVRAARKGVPDAVLHSIATVAMLAAGIQDTCVGLGLYRGPMLLSLGFLVAVGAIGRSLTQAFVRSARELDGFSRRLEQVVEERTRELVAAEADLLRADKMAALGQLSAGVAHEINNPAAAVMANLTYLRDGVRIGKAARDTAECLDESLESMGRIAKIVRHLLDSGRDAGNPSQSDSVSVLRAVQQAFVVARPRIGPHVVTSVDVPGRLFVRGEEGPFVQVLVNLLVNAAQAIPAARRAGHIAVRAARTEGRVALEIVDDGAGMTEETRRRLFEPFFTTRPFGEGTGLGLSVSLGLLRSMGGELQVLSVPGRTAMTVVLDEAEAGVASSSLPMVAARVALRSLLIVDDDPLVGRSLARSLRPSFEVCLAGGIAAAHAELDKRSFDIILSDLQMPGGGGRQLFEDLALRSPELARRVILFSGGEASEEDRPFFEKHGVQLLAKPLALDSLLEAMDRIERTTRPAVV